jgi:crotonobetainyl-CoA:carnitine CoA-transferase CaiB-like acyl-CoA transferase
VIDTMYATPAADAEGPLAGLRVVDLTRARSGPTCVRQLADMGADVVQVVAPGLWDLAGSDASNLHRNKRSVLLDLTQEACRDALLRLVRNADVLVENFRPGVKHRLGIDPDTLLAINPRLVYASISGFGQDGPYAEHPGIDQIAQGLGGLMSVTGPPGSGPWRVGIAISDTASGTLLTQGVLAALLARDRTGRGQWVHTSLLESMISFMDFQAARWLIDGDVPAQAGNDHPTVAAMGTFRTVDGYINVAALNDFDGFCAAIGAAQLANDERFRDAPARTKNRNELHDAIAAVLETRTTAALLTALAGRWPCGPILGVDEVFADPQVRHLNVTRSVEHPVDGPINVLRHPLTFSATPATIRRGPPVPGHDSREILAELGYTVAEIDDLIAAHRPTARKEA